MARNYQEVKTNLPPQVAVEPRSYWPKADKKAEIRLPVIIMFEETFDGVGVVNALLWIWSSECG